MPQNTIQPSFSAGELAPSLYGRVDLAKYRTGAEVMRNFFVDYRGGASTRPGTLFCGVSQYAYDNYPPRLIPFIFNSTQAYVLELGAGGMRIISDGAYVTEAPFDITAATLSYPLTMTIPGNNFNFGDSIYIDGIDGLNVPNGTPGVNGLTLEVVSSGDVVTCVYVGPQASNGYPNSTDWTAYVSGGTASRIYTVETPWANQDLYALNYAQSADVLTITHPSYAPTDIDRVGAANWTITAEVIGATIEAPTGVSSTGVGGTTGTPLSYPYCVTAINTNANNEESVASLATTCANFPLNQDTGVVNYINWTAAAGATAYNVYKAIPTPIASPSTAPWFWGFIGTSTSNNFCDNNIEPDFAQVPPTGQNPFGAGPIASLIVRVAGYGYIDPLLTIPAPPGGTNATLSVSVDAHGSIIDPVVTAGGTGYIGNPDVNVIEGATTPGTGLTLAFSGAWQLVPATDASTWEPVPGSITITNGGSHYHVPVIDYGFTVGSGSNVIGQIGGYFIGFTTGASVTSLGAGGTPQVFTSGTVAPTGVTLLVSVDDQVANESSGVANVQATLGGTNYPACVAYFDQRRFFAASDDSQDTFWASKPGSYTNFDTSYPSQADDSITGTIVGQEVNAIGSLTAMNSGLIALTTSGAYQISGGAVGAALTPSTVTAQAQAFSGASDLPPLRVGYDLIYQSARGTAIRDLSYNFYVNVYTGTDISALSSHLFYGRDILQWTYAEEPFKLIWAVRDDGVMLSLTYLKEQEVYGWARHDTCGQFASVTTIPENGEDTVYVIVQRLVNNEFYYFTERMQSRLFGANPGMNVPADPEKVWCVDAGVEYAQPTPAANIEFIVQQPQGVVYSVTVVDGGSGYPDAPFCQIIDEGGTGALITLAAVDGVITSGTVITSGSNYNNPTVSVAGGTGAVISLRIVNPWQVHIDADIFQETDVGSVLRAGGGRGTVIEFIDNFNEIVDIDIPFAALTPNTQIPTLAPVPQGQWTLTPPTQVVSGLGHLEGSYVAVVADGSVQENQIVSQGCITLQTPATQILAGQAYTAQLKTMRVDVGEPTIQGKRKTIVAATLRTVDTRGLSVGPDFDTLTPIKQRDYELYGNPDAFQTGGGQIAPDFPNGPLSPRPLDYADTRTVIEATWNTDGYLCFQQNYPMPATILADIAELEVGDT